ncbi:predicted protein [Chaetoceros tenuissimus]|uniref:Uncharacterized protein n=1 Tax=Chaetoceros tenuissimus TaxID=426638 RepID=A0AAD3CF63_9STRA|nr:predicted protein [Chaetoceros tenuissimus]
MGTAAQVLEVGEQYPVEQSLPDAHGEPTAPSLQNPKTQIDELQSLPDPRAPSLHEPETQNDELQSLPVAHGEPKAPSVHELTTVDCEEWRVERQKQQHDNNGHIPPGHSPSMPAFLCTFAVGASKTMV